MTKFAKEKPNDCRGCKHRKDCGGNLKECYCILPEEQVPKTAPSAYPCNHSFAATFSLEQLVSL